MRACELGSVLKQSVSHSHLIALLCLYAADGGSPQVAMEGDTVTIHYVCRDEQGAVVDDSSRAEEPVSFEVGAGEVTGNPLFQVPMNCCTIRPHACKPVLPCVCMPRPLRPKKPLEKWYSRECRALPMHMQS